MQPLAFYLLKVIACSGILLLYYRLALRNKRFHYYNRFYLLMAMAASLLLPLLTFTWLTVESNNKAITLFTAVIVQGGAVYATKQQGFSFTSINWQLVSATAYIAVSLLLLVVLTWRILKIYRLKKKYAVVNMAEFDFVNTDIAQAPFSFLHNLFWREDIDMNEATGRQILQHELTHIRQKHTWDKLWMQIITSVLWVNPFFWFIQKELCMLHEFIADEKAIENNDGAAFAAMLLTSQYGKNIFSPAQQFSYSPIKRRLFMLTNLTKPRYSYARRLMVLPLLATVVLLFAFRLKTNATGAKHDAVVAASDTAKGKNKANIINDANSTSAQDEPAIRFADTTKPLPLFVLNGTIVEKSAVDALKPDDIESINVLKGTTAIDKYGDKATNGVVEVITKNTSSPKTDDTPENKNNNAITLNKKIEKNNQSGIKVLPNVLYIVDGKIVSKEDVEKIANNDIYSVDVLKGKTAIDKYGDKADNGAIEITLRTPGAEKNSSTHAISHPGGGNTNISADSLILHLHNDNGSNHETIYQGSHQDSIQAAMFPGGDEAWKEYLIKQLHADIPAKKGGPPGTYTAVVSFTIDVDGNLSQVKAEKDPGYGTGAEAVRVIQRGPKWIPAKREGQPVTVRQKQSITFQISE